MSSTQNLAEFQAAARAFVSGLRPRPDRATLVTLSGDLGAGKTSFVQEVAKTLGIPETVSSPTFVIQKLYPVPKGPFTKLVHIDAYRLTGAKELEKINWAELLEDSGALIMLEWPENVIDAIPPDAISITFKNPEGERREISYLPR